VRRIIVDAINPGTYALDEAVRAIHAGGIVALPTETLYGLAVDPFRAESVERVFAVKKRVAGRALPLIASDGDQVTERFGALPAAARQLALRFWPGPLTLLVAAPLSLAPGVSGGTGKVGVRVPSHAVARALCRACGFPLTATSANISGAAAPADPDDVELRLGNRIDVLVDSGATAGGPPSTIVDVTGPVPLLVRAGAIRWDEIQACLQGTAWEDRGSGLEARGSGLGPEGVLR
jgi:L-threonylcarbamoyladenylate synthase